MTAEPNVIKAYSAPPWLYDIRGFLILTFSYQSSLLTQIRFFSANMKSNHLEIAVGTGTLLWLTLWWRKFKKLPAVKITAVDYVPSMLDGAIRRFKKYPNITLGVADAAALKFADNTFDSINIANSIHCFSNIDAALAETFRVLKPGGTFASNVLLYPEGQSLLQQIARRINAWGINKGLLYTPYYQAEIKNKISSAGFTVQTEKVSGNSFQILAAKPS